VPTCVASVVSTQYVLHTTSRAIQKMYCVHGKKTVWPIFGTHLPSVDVLAFE